MGGSSTAITITDLEKRLRSLSGRWSLHDIFRDWVESMAYAIANRVDHRPAIRDARERAYMQIVERHGAEASAVMNAFAEMMGMLTMLLEEEPAPVLGQLFMTLDLSGKDAGQFFTPMPVAELMATMALGSDEPPPCGFFTLHEPAIGGGETLIGMARALLQRGLNPSQHMHVTGVDIERKVLLMAYVQLSLLGIPAVLYDGDSLRMVFHDAWYTPAHVLGGWEHRLAMAQAISRAEAGVRELFGEAPQREQPLQPRSCRTCASCSTQAGALTCTQGPVPVPILEGLEQCTVARVHWRAK